MYRLFFNLAQCFSFLGVVFALIKDYLNREVLLTLSFICIGFIVLFIVLMMITYEKDENTPTTTRKTDKVTKHY